MSEPVLPPELWVFQPLRGVGTQASASFKIQSLEFTFSWGAQPGSATITYVKESLDSADSTYAAIIAGGVAVNSYCEIRFAGRTYYGVCVSDTALDASGGKLRVLEFEDLRRYLTWDQIFGAWNVPDKRIVGSRRVRQYKHLLPVNYENGAWTYTNAPLSAAQICNSIFTAPTTGTSWFALYHADMVTSTLLNVDASSGKRLDGLLSEISARLGLVFTLAGRHAATGQPVLYWTRKGFLSPGETLDPGSLDTNGSYVFPTDTDNCRAGYALSGQPTRVFVVGDRNVYQVINVNLVKDWAAGWEQFYDSNLFVDYVFRNGLENGVHYDAIVGDVEHIRGRLLARVFAQSITVRQFIEDLNDANAGTGEPFRDERKFAGRSRMDMPAYLYINTILFRAYRPPPTVTIGGVEFSRTNLLLTEGMLVRILFDPITGAMTPSYTLPADGNGFALARGYQIGSELFRSIQPDRFNLADWNEKTQLWGPAQFQIDDSGEGDQFIAFDEPIIESAELIDSVASSNGRTYAVFKARPVITVPQVKASLTFQGKRFIYRTQIGNGSLDITVNEPGLHGEFVSDVTGATAFTEIPYEDGSTAAQRAVLIGLDNLARQFLIGNGGYRRYLFAGSVATGLNGFYDRIHLHYGPDGHYEVVDFANERGSNAFEPERDYDRRQAERFLFPGQRELNENTRQQGLLAAGLKQVPKFYRQMSQAFHGFGGTGRVIDVPVTNSTRTTPLAAGTPLWGVETSTGAVVPEVSAAAHKVFRGVTVRSGEPVAIGATPKNVEMPAQITGLTLVRAIGPVEVGDTLVRVTGQDYVISENSASAATDAPAIGKAMQSIPDGSVVLIQFMAGQGGGGGRMVARWA